MLWVITAVLVQVILLGARQQTVGKLVLRMRIVRMDGGPPGFFHVVGLRYVLWLLLPLVFGVGRLEGLVNDHGLVRALLLADALTIGVGDSSRCLHDFLAGTKVVMLLRRAPKQDDSPPGMSQPT